MSKKIDIKGQRFGFWVVKERAPNTSQGRTQWVCVCECGKEKVITTNSLRSGNSTSCGCNHNPDLTNTTFGELKVISLDQSKGKSIKRYWICKCSCGSTRIVTTNQLRNNLVTSCGCKTLATSQLLRDQLKVINLRSHKLISEQSIIIEQFNLELEKSIRLLKEIRENLR